MVTELTGWRTVRWFVGIVTATVTLAVSAVTLGIVPARYHAIACTLSEGMGAGLLCYGFVRNALVAGMIIGVIGPMIGTFLVYRGMALIGETLAHTAYAGVAVGTVLGGVGSGWRVVAAMTAAVLGALGVQVLAERTGSHGDVPIAIVLTGSFALGTLVIGLGGGFGMVDVRGLLFGSIATVTPSGIRILAVMGFVVVGAVAASYKQFVYLTFDEDAARVVGVDVRAFNGLLIVLAAIVVVGAIQLLGVILVAALLVVPVATADRVGLGFRDTLYLAVALGELSTIAGLVVAYRYSIAPGATIVLLAIAIYLIVVLIEAAR